MLVMLTFSGVGIVAIVIGIVVNIGIVATFSAFPLLHLYQFDPLDLWRRTKSESIRAYRRAEYGYVWASLLAKSTLVFTIGAAAFMRSD